MAAGEADAAGMGPADCGNSVRNLRLMQRTMNSPNVKPSWRAAAWASSNGLNMAQANSAASVQVEVARRGAIPDETT